MPSRRGGACWLLIAALLIAAGACSRPPQLADTAGGGSSTSGGNPWEQAARQWRKDTTFAVCRSVLTTLNHELAAQSPSGTVPSAEYLDALGRLVPLDAGDREELRAPQFTPHDAAYVAECFYLRDVARSLAVPGLSPQELADRAFVWVCRHVYLHPWLLSTERGIIATALPPAYVLRRGYGSGLERMYVFLGLLQQLQLDGCLLGPPEGVEHHAGHVALAADNATVLTGTPRGPFWAVGVRINGDIRLYDPWRETPLPGTLRQLREQPDAHQAWFASPEHRSGLTLADCRTATVYLAVPVNSLSRRMALLHEKAGNELQVVLACEPQLLRERFGEWQPRYWNPAGDRFAYGRTARMFLPLDQGGSDASPAGSRLFDLYYLSQMPTAEQVVPASLRQNAALMRDLGERIAQTARTQYAIRFLEPPTPRERLQRGQFQDAVRLLVGLQDEFTRGLSRVRNTPNAEQVRREWIEQAAALYEQLGRAPDALARIERHWREPAAALLLDQAVCEIGLAEATFLLALCQHEQAERLQLRYERAAPAEQERLRSDVRAAWAAAAREWRTYRGQYAALHTALVGRTATADRLAARAEALARQ